MVETELKLKVAEAVQDDVNKGIVRIDTTLMHEIVVRPGDIVEIEGSRVTVGIADRAYPGDIGLSIIRMDGIIRRNARAGIGELVKIRKADIKGAKKVVAYCTHAVLSGNAVKNIEASQLDELVVTDTIPLRSEAAMSGRIRQLSVATMLAESVCRISEGESLSSMFVD